LNSSGEFNYEIAWNPTGNRPGHHESLARGGGFRFREHLPLMRHPDARRIDLHATLRDPFGEIKVRTYRERRAITVTVLADLSASMAYGGKWDVLSAFSVAAARSAYRTGDAFGFLGAARDIAHDLRMEPRRSRGQGSLLEARLRAVTPQGDSNAGLLQASGYLGCRHSLVFLVSDFHGPTAEIRALLESLARHTVIPVVVWDRAEFAIPEVAGWYESVDMESGAHRTLWLRPGWRARVRAGIRRRQRELQAMFLDAGARPLALGAPFDAGQVTEYFTGGGEWPDVAG